MTRFTKISIALALAFGAVPAFAGNGDMLQIRDQLQLHDGSCLLEAEELLADETLTLDQVQDRLRDRSCLIDDDETAALQTRTRTGEENGKGNVWRHRNEGGAKTQSGSGGN